MTTNINFLDKRIAFNILKECIIDGDIEGVRQLLADPRTDPSLNNNFAVHLASDHGHPDIVKLLSEHIKDKAQLKKTITFVIIDSTNNNSEVYFKMHDNAPIRKALEAFCQRQGRACFGFKIRDSEITDFNLNPKQLELNLDFDPDQSEPDSNSIIIAY